MLRRLGASVVIHAWHQGAQKSDGSEHTSIGHFNFDIISICFLRNRVREKVLHGSPRILSKYIDAVTAYLTSTILSARREAGQFEVYR